MVSALQSMSAKELRSEKIRIWKNVIAISFSFLCLFTASNGVANLQSSINSDAGLGTWSQATLYIALVFSCIFVPSWLIKTLGCKWTMVVSQLCYSVYFGVQLHPSFASLIPGAFVLGLAAAPNWAAKCTYLTKAGNRYATLVGEKTAEPSIARFFGFFFMACQSSFVWGSLISSLVLSQGQPQNKTLINDERLNLCGANFCNNMDLSNVTDISGPILERPPTEQIHFLMYILLGSAILASIVIALLVDPLKEEDSLNSKKAGFELLIATVKHMKNPYQMFIIPLTLWSGFQLAFIMADFSAAFIACSWGVENIGFVLLCFGVTDAIGCLVCGNLVKKIGRIPLFIYGGAMNLALIITLLIWRPDPAEPAVYFVIAALWGSADAVWQTQINSFYGIIFPSEEEAAFSNYRLWESLGLAIVFSYSTAFCTDVKLYIMMTLLIFGMIGYFTIEIMERNKRNKEKVTSRGGAAARGWRACMQNSCYF